MTNEDLQQLKDAIAGCEKYSSDADFEVLGAIVFRNREVLLAFIDIAVARLMTARPAPGRSPELANDADKRRIEDVLKGEGR